MFLFWYIAYNRSSKSLVRSYYIAREGSFSNNYDLDIIYIRNIRSSTYLLKLIKSSLIEMLMMMNAGLSIMDALNHIGKGPTEVSGIFAHIYIDVSEGVALGMSIKSHITVIDPILASLLSIAEDHTHLINLIQNGIAYLDYRINLFQGIRTALYYPLFVLSVLTFIVWFQMFQLECVSWFLAIILTCILCIFIMIFMYSDKLYLGKDYYRACYFYSISSAIKSGLSAQDAVALVRDSFGGNELERVEFCILNGGKFSSALSGLDPVVMGILDSGEQCGNIGSACQYVSDFYMNKTKLHLDKILGLAGPLLIAITGMILTGIVAYTSNYYYGLVNEW